MDDIFTLVAIVTLFIISLFTVAGILHIWRYLYDRKDDIE